MSLFLPGRKASHKRFSYEPRYYDPSRDEKLKSRMRIKSRARRRRSPVGIIYFLMLLGMAIYIYSKLT